MKKFKIKNLDNKLDIGKLLSNYSKSLSEDSNNVLSGLTENKISDGKIIYEYKIKYGENLSCKIFEISLFWEKVSMMEDYAKYKCTGEIPEIVEDWFNK